MAEAKKAWSPGWLKNLGKIGTVVPTILNPIGSAARNVIGTAKDGLCSVLNFLWAKKLWTKVKWLTHRIWEVARTTGNSIVDALSIIPRWPRTKEELQPAYARTYGNLKKTYSRDWWRDPYGKKTEIKK